MLRAPVGPCNTVTRLVKGRVEGFVMQMKRAKNIPKQSPAEHLIFQDLKPATG